MSLEWPRVASVSTLPTAHPPRAESPDPDATPRFAQVLDLEQARLARRGARSMVPREVIDEIAAAARLYDELSSAGLNVRFEAPEGGRISAQLTDAHTGVPIRRLSLREVVGSDGDFDMPPTAA